MKTLDWYFDFVSPYSYLQHEILHTLDAEIRYKPILFAVLLNAWDTKGRWKFRKSAASLTVMRCGLPASTAYL